MSRRSRTGGCCRWSCGRDGRARGRAGRCRTRGRSCGRGRFLGFHKSFRRRIRRHGRFRPHLGPGALRRRTVGDGSPTVVDLNLGDPFLDRARPMESGDIIQQRDRDDDFVAAHSRSRAIAIYFGVTTQPISLHRLPAPRAHLVIVRPLINDRRIRVGDVGDVRRFIHDGDVTLGGHHGAPHVLRTEFVAGNKRILIRADVVITVRPIVDAVLAIEARFRGQWRPADIILARAPGNPGRGPFVARHPDPADAPEPKPASVMISRPAKRLIGNPGPAGVAINPTPLRIRPPVPRFFGHARLPDETVIRRFPPSAVRLEFLVKDAVGCSRFRARFSSRLRSLARDDLGRSRGRRFRGRLRGRFFIRQRFLPRFQISLLLREALFLIGLAFARETFLHLAFNFRFLLLFGLLLLAGNKKCQGCDERQNGKLLHGVVRQGWFLVIRTKVLPGP